MAVKRSLMGRWRRGINWICEVSVFQMVGNGDLDGGDLALTREFWDV